MARHMIVKLPSGDWQVLSGGYGRVEVLVVGDEALEDLRAGADIERIGVQSRFGVYLTDHSGLTGTIESRVTKES